MTDQDACDVIALEVLDTIESVWSVVDRLRVQQLFDRVSDEDAKTLGVFMAAAVLVGKRNAEMRLNR